MARGTDAACVFVMLEAEMSLPWTGILGYAVWVTTLWRPVSPTELQCGQVADPLEIASAEPWDRLVATMAGEALEHGVLH